MLYPLFLQLKGRHVLVAGGGHVGLRKAESLLEAGARVTVVSPSVLPELRRLRKIRRLNREYRASDVKACALVFACTNDRAVNRQIVRDARKLGILAQSVTDPAASDFHVPSTVARGALQVAISTGGASPALAKLLRERAGKLVPEGFERYAELLERVRKWQLGQRSGPDENARAFRALVRGPLERAVVNGDRTAAERALKTVLGSPVPVARLFRGLV